MNPKVIVVCGDPGGAAAVAPVVKELERDGLVEMCDDITDAHFLLYGTSMDKIQK